MRKLILVTFLAAAAAFAQQGAPAKTKALTKAEFDNLMSNPGQVLLLDVRRPDEITSNGGFPVYLSIQAADLEKHLAEIPKDRPIVTVSNHANRASAAADKLRANGFKVAGAVGAQTYEEEGGKLVVKIAPPKPADKK
jgi:rhodanese-related sulfurtransferase